MKLTEVTASEPTLTQAEKRKIYFREWQRRKNGTTIPLGSEIPCQSCGTMIIKRGGLQKYCGPCREESQRTINRLLKRVELSAKKNRPLAIFGETVQCAGEACQELIVRKSAAHKYCDNCKRESRLATVRKASAVQRLKRGVVPVKGTVIQCAHCGKDTVRNAKARKYCDDCAPDMWFKCPTKSLNLRIANGIRQSLGKGKKRRQHWEDVVGWTLEDLRRHLERQFRRGMDWTNYGSVWHIDHIVPLSSFRYEEASDPEFKAAWALTNLRPLGAKENLTKHAKRLLLL